MSAEYYESKPVVVARDEVPADSLKRQTMPINRLDYVLPLLAKFYDPNWRKAPLIPHDAAKDELAKSQFSYGYALKVWWEPVKKELWAVIAGTKDAVEKAESGEWSTGFSIDFDWLTRVNADGSLALIPYLLHIAPCGSDQPALSGMSSPGELYQLTAEKILPSPVTGMALSFAEITTISPTILKGKEEKMDNTTEVKADTGTDKPVPEGESTAGKGTSAFINYKEIKRAHSAINAAIGDSAAMKKAQDEFDASVAAAISELEALGGESEDTTEMCNKEALSETTPPTPSESELSLKKQLDEAVRHDIGVQLLMIGATDEQKTAFLAAIPAEGLSLNLIQPMLDMLENNLIKSKLPSENRFALGKNGTGLNNVTMPQEAPKDLAELKSLGVHGYALYLKSTPEGKDRDFDPEREFNLMAEILAEKKGK